MVKHKYCQNVGYFKKYNSQNIQKAQKYCTHLKQWYRWIFNHLLKNILLEADIINLNVAQYIGFWYECRFCPEK